MELRDRIKKIRKDAGLTQAEFSVKLGLGATGGASNWEKKDPQEPTETVKLLICKTFGIREEWLKYGTGQMKEDDSALINHLADTHNLGASGKAILSIALDAITTLDEKTSEMLIDRLFDKIQELKGEQSSVNPESAVVDESSSSAPQEACNE